MERTLYSLVKNVLEGMLDSIMQGRFSRESWKKDAIRKISDGVVCEDWKREVLEWHLGELLEAERRLGSVVALEARLASPGLVGASSGLLTAVFEVGLEWDYVLDLPVVPASTLKGAARAALLQRCASAARGKELVRCVELTYRLLGVPPLPPREEIEEVAALTGLPREAVRDALRRVASTTPGCSNEHCLVGAKGLLRFHDTYLYCCDGDGRLLEPWVITPHYRRERVETEYDAQPTPVQHLVLRPGLCASIVVGIDSRDAAEASRVVQELAEFIGVERGDDWRATLVNLLALVLRSGVGARTSRGYSVFDVRAAYVG